MKIQNLPKGTKRKAQAARQVAITENQYGRKVVHKEETEVLQTGDESTEQATVGVSLGLTIPGPKDSFMSARCDAWCSVPCGVSDGEIHAAYKRASEIVADQLEKDAEVVTSFFESL